MSSPEEMATGTQESTTEGRLALKVPRFFFVRWDTRLNEMPGQVLQTKLPREPWYSAKSQGKGKTLHFTLL